MVKEDQEEAKCVFIHRRSLVTSLENVVWDGRVRVVCHYLYIIDQQYDKLALEETILRTFTQNQDLSMTLWTGLCTVMTLRCSDHELTSLQLRILTATQSKISATKAQI